MTQSVRIPALRGRARELLATLVAYTAIALMLVLAVPACLLLALAGGIRVLADRLLRRLE